MATEHTLTIDAGQSESINVDTSQAVVLDVAVDPGGPRNRGSSDPPIREYQLTIEKNTPTGFQEVSGSPLFETDLDERNFVVADITGTTRITITNEGLSRGTVTLTTNTFTGDRATEAVAKGMSVRALDGAMDRLFTRQGAVSDTGEFFRNIQDAIDASTRMTIFGPGTFEESVVINQDGFTLAGYGFESRIDATGIGSILENNGDDVELMNFSGLNSPGDGIGMDGFGDDPTYTNIRILDSDSSAIFDRGSLGAYRGIVVDSADNVGINSVGNAAVIQGCRIRSGVGGTGIRAQQPRTTVTGCGINGAGNHGINGDSFIVTISGCVARNCTEDGIFTNDNVVTIGFCLCLDNGDDGIDIQGTDDIVVSNVTAGNGNNGIETSSATTPEVAHNRQV